MINYVAIYIIVNEYEKFVMVDEVEVNTKYKMVDTNVKPMATPPSRDSWQMTKEAVVDPYLRDLGGPSHTFVEET